jgi:hypothetical protein
VIVVKFSNFPAISWQEQVNFQLENDEVRFVQDEHVELDFYSALPPPAVKPSNNRSQFASTLSKSTQVYLQKIQLQF